MGIMTIEEFFTYADADLTRVKLALEAGADISSNQRKAGAALVTAAFMGRADIVELLLSKGVSVAQRINKTTYSALHGAACMGKTEVVELLVHRGATVDSRDMYQMTPIMHACVGGHDDTVRRLIEFGARLDLVDLLNNKTPLQICNYDTGYPEYDIKKIPCIQPIQDALEKKQLRCCNPICGKTGYRKSQIQKPTLKLCGACKLTRYCSRECQKQHWSVGHKKCCGHDGYSGPVPDEYHTIEYMMMLAMAKARGVTLDICNCSLCQ